MGKKTRSKAKKDKARERREAGEDDPNKHNCLFCKCLISNSEDSLNEHYSGKMHRRLEKLHLYILFFEKHSIFPSIGRKTYECRECGKDGIPADVKKLKAHIFNVHSVGPSKQYPHLPLDTKMWYSGSENPVVINRVQRVRPKVYWAKEYEIQQECQSFERISSPTLCVDTTGCGFHFLLVNGQFNSNLLIEMTEHASFLEAYGNLTKRGEMKRAEHDSRIVTFGFRYAYGEIGRFKHKIHACYYRADLLCTMISNHLKTLFPEVYKHLEEILLQEGIGEEDNVTIGNTPFTTMSITKNYHCNIHTDSDDVSYGFFIWFGSNGTKDKHGNEASFHLPGVKLFTIPLIGDVLLCKASELVHCTRTIGDRGQYGIALYQKASFFRWYAIVKSSMSGDVYDKLTLSWIRCCNEKY